MIRAISVVLTVITFAFSIAQSASAGLTGSNIQAQWYFPDLSTVLQNMGSATVSPTAVFDLHIGNLVSHDVFTTVSDQNISVSVTNDAGDFFGAGTFNGPSLHFLASSHLITNISLDPATNVSGFDLSRVSVVPDASGGQFVDINVQGFTFPTNNWLISLDVQSVPEPSTILLLGLGAAGVALKMRRRFGRATRSLAAILRFLANQ